MTITGNPDKLRRIESARQLLNEIGPRDQAAQRLIETAISQYQQDRFLLTIIGKAKRGKSTLINALLGRRDDLVAPIDRLPASNAISRYSLAPKEQATVVFRDGRSVPVPFSAIRNYVTEELNPGNRQEVAEVLIAGPFKGLDADLELVDTPGAGSIHEHHDSLLHGFLPQSDAVIFLVTAHLPLDREELELLKRVKAADIRKVFFAINRMDEADAEELDQATEHNRRVLHSAEIPVEQIHHISAKRAFQGEINSSGVPELLAEINLFLTKNKGSYLASQFASRVANAATPVLQGLRVETASARKSGNQINLEIEQLTSKKRSLESERKSTGRAFSTAWERGLDSFQAALGPAKRRMCADLQRKIGGTGLLEVSSLVKELPPYFQEIIETNYGVAAKSFEAEARAACEKLNADYPRLNVLEEGEIAIRTQSGVEFVTGIAGGAATAAVGVGFATAGAAAGATIAAANVAALSATTTVAAPSLLTGGITAVANFFGAPMIGGVLAPLATGTATVATPAAVTTAPLWVALAGPVGWTLAGLGLAAIPLVWRMNRLKQLSQIESACLEQADLIDREFREQRIPLLHRSGVSILTEIELALDRQLAQIEDSLRLAKSRGGDPGAAQVAADNAESISKLVAQLASGIHH